MKRSCKALMRFVIEFEIEIKIKIAIEIVMDDQIDRDHRDHDDDRV